MKIITLEGENLASLAAPFHIDFATGMLADAGLFAICGNTGSGKSTLLDAICLSLFDAMPRFTASRRGASIGHVDSEEAERLKSNDVRHILTRGASNGFSQVVFELDNGKRYQAKWSVKRARNSSTGRFQSQEMQLTDCQTNQVLATKKTEVLSLIESLIGLNYEQFKRSVLLAQGDFAAFLKAPVKERSALLERITGTEIYSDISKQAFEKSKIEEQALEILTSKLGDVELLTPALQEQLANSIREANEKVNQITEQQQSLEWLSQKLLEKENLEITINDSKSALLNAMENIKQQESINQILDKIEQAQDARVVFVQRQQHYQESQLLTDNITQLQNQYNIDQQEFKSIEQQVLQLTQLKDQAQSYYEQKLPDIELAITKSIELNGLKDKISNTEQQLAQLSEQRSNNNQLQIANEKNLALVNQDINACQHYLIEHDYMASLVSNYSVVEQHIEEYGDAKKQLLEHQKKQESNNLHIQEIAEQSAALTASADQHQQLIQQQQTQLDQFTESFKQNNLQVLEEQLAQQQATYTALQHEQQIILQGLQYQSMITQKNQQVEEIEQELVQLRNSYRQSKQQLDQKIPVVNEAANALMTAQQVMSLSDHRANLVEGEPCALCGSCDHPYQGSDLGNEMVEQLSQRHQQLIQQVRSCEDELTKFDVMGKQKTEQIQQLTHQKNELIQLIKQLDIQELSVNKQANVEHQLATTVNEIEGLKAKISQVSEVVSQAQQLEKTILKQQHTLDTTKQDIANGQQQSIALENDNKSITQSNEQLKQRQTARVNALTSIFNRVNWEDILSLDVEISAFKREMNEQMSLYQEQQTKQQTLSETVGQLQQEQIVLRERDSHNEGQYKPLKVQHEQDSERFNTQANILTQLLNGDDPQQLKQQLEQKNKELSIAHQHANSSLTNQRQNELITQSKLAQAQERIIDIERVRSQLDGQWRDWQSKLHMDEESLIQLLTYEPEWIVEQRQTQAQLLQQTHQAETIVAQQQKQLTSVKRLLSDREIELSTQFPTLAPSPSDTTEPQRTMVASSLKAQLAQINEQLFEHRSRLQQHNQGMVLFGQLQEEINKQQKSTQLWLNMKELIGSADGGKFRTFAQSLTLEQMLTGANYHLKDLAPRYALQRVPGGELDLQMIDRDMGDEVRSIDSLSGGETFLVSLALALGLGSLTGLQTSIRSLFIDEGFGTLDPNTLELALSCLDS